MQITYSLSYSHTPVTDIRQKQKYHGLSNSTYWKPIIINAISLPAVSVVWSCAWVRAILHTSTGWEENGS